MGPHGDFESGLDDRGLLLRAPSESTFLSTPKRPCRNKPPILRLPGAFFPELKRPLREAGHLPLSSGVATSPLPPPPGFRDRFVCLVALSEVMLSVQVVLWGCVTRNKQQRDVIIQGASV